ncbi:GDSL-type esterase/lipase family protein [Nannocystis radixulma]|uniref:GDSL-type esterase/lipase family protein n=1 Tax=Nannocystis radixulma TaxID=2995305 RepID=UPI00232CA00C|nr:GDSL-type esterase/lipase family protein [Nannocystis radixulma]
MQVQVPPPGPTPALTDAARDARLWAQRAILGERAALLDDSAGQPFPVIPLAAGGDLQAALMPGAGPGNLDALPGSEGVGPGGTGVAPAINGNALGQFILLQRGADDPLQHFHEALRRLDQGLDEDGKVRVLVYGASHTAADIYPTYLRAYLQKRFGDGGLGFYPLAKPSKFTRPFACSIENSRGWKIEHAQRSEARDDGYFGLLGASASASKKRDVTRVSFNPPLDRKAEPPGLSRYDLYFLRQPGGGKFQVLFGGKKAFTVDTKAKQPGPGYHSFDRPGPPETIEIRPVGDGEVRLFGVTVENEARGVVVDTLGIGGTRASNHLKWDEFVWADNYKRRAPDLVILAYGSNESVDDDQPIGVYKNNLREVLARLRRASPETSCVLVGPGDFPLKRPDNSLGPRPRVADIVAVQRELAREAGCAFWDTVQFMGGEGSMAYWAGAQPAMAMSDHLHLNRRGYTRMGMALTDALMFDFDGGSPAPGGDPVLAREAPQPDPTVPPGAVPAAPAPAEPAPEEASDVPPLAVVPASAP